MDYKQAGVNIEAGDQFVDWIKSSSPKYPFQNHLVQGVGGFASIFRMDFPDIKKPCLVSATDGVGTKLKLATHFDRYDFVGQDLVAMCVNDLICTGAQPLFFLDYFSTGKLELPVAKEFISGVQKACVDSGCALVGGETAEMPGVYPKGEFDAAGFAIGVVGEDQILGPQRVKEGMALIGLKSSGFHSNGFSLLRKLFEADLDKWEAELCSPTHLYPSVFNDIDTQHIAAVAHITGGGMDNLLRVLPPGLKVELNPWAWTPAYQEVQERSGLSQVEMLKTFNCGVGLVLVCEVSKQKEHLDKLKNSKFEAFDLGRLKSGESSWEIL